MVPEQDGPLSCSQGLDSGPVSHLLSRWAGAIRAGCPACPQLPNSPGGLLTRRRGSWVMFTLMGEARLWLEPHRLRLTS